MDDKNRTVDIQADTTALKPSDTKTPPNSPPRPKSWWETKLQARKLAIMWFTTTILGMLFISLTSGASRLFIPILLLSTYAWYGYKYVESAGELIALRQARVGQLADSVYFLGFLWTLYALIDSFVIQPEVSIAEAVFRAFGYALVTTATGMFLRLFLLQFGYSEEEQVRLAKQNVEEEIARFANELTRGTDSIGNFHAGINSLNHSVGALRSSVDETKNQMSDLTTRLAKLHSDSLARLEEHTKNSINDLVRELDFTKIREKMQTELQEAVRALRDTVSKTTRSIETTTNKFTDTASTQTEKLGLSLQGVSNQIAQIRVPSDIIERTVGEQVNKVTSTLADSSKDVQEALKRLSEQISNVRIPADIVEKTMTAQLEESIRSFQEALRRLAKQIDDVRVPADVVEKIVTHKVETATAGLTRSISALQEAINNLERSVQTITGQVRTVRFKPWWKFWA
ncbi:MAG: hypothetical protein HY562_03135 [Ignavibacteriales bacterium]|nr:hypothetical protein [Ignavibacteriales bacterium]